MTEKVTFSDFDPADYLDTQEAIESYLDAVMRDSGNDPSAIAHALGVVARASNMSQLARETGISREGLNKALSGKGNPTLETIVKVSVALGLQMAFHSKQASPETREGELTAP